MRKKIKKKIGTNCEVEGYIDMSNEEKPHFKITMKGDGCPKDLSGLQD